MERKTAENQLGRKAVASAAERRTHSSLHTIRNDRSGSNASEGSSISLDAESGISLEVASSCSSLEGTSAALLEWHWIIQEGHFGKTL